jgi:hypothetical protein
MLYTWAEKRKAIAVAVAVAVTIPKIGISKVGNRGHILPKRF